MAVATGTGYAVALGYDQAEENLVLLDPQPQSSGLYFSSFVYGGDGLVHDDGYALCEFFYRGQMFPDVYASLVNQLGLTNVRSRTITARLQKEARSGFIIVNAVVVKPSTTSGMSLSTHYVEDAKFSLRRVRET